MSTACLAALDEMLDSTSLILNLNHFHQKSIYNN